jgi:hypothetical protein
MNKNKYNQLFLTQLGENPMKTQRISQISRLILVASLLAGQLVSSLAAAVSLDEPASTGLQTAVSAPLILPIPEVAAGVSSPSVDGACDTTEYSSGWVETFIDGPDVPGTGIGYVYLVHDADYMYVCIISPKGSLETRFDSLYVDPQGDGSTYTYAQDDDYSLRLDFTGGKTSFRGNGLISGWTDSSIYDNSIWSGAASTSVSDITEYRLFLPKFGLSVCSTFRLAGYHHHFAFSGNDYGWTSNQYYDQPGTWRQVLLDSSTCMAKSLFLPLVTK